MATMNSHYQTAQQQHEKPFNRTFDNNKLTQALLNTSIQGKNGPKEQPKRVEQHTSNQLGVNSSLHNLL